MGDSWNWPKDPPPPLEGGDRRHPDERLGRAALAGLVAGLVLGFAFAWLWL